MPKLIRLYIDSVLVGFALAIGDWAWLKASLRTLLLGSAMAVLLCAVLVFLSPIQSITSEIASRVAPVISVAQTPWTAMVSPWIRSIIAPGGFC